MSMTSWPPRVGESLPRGGAAVGLRRKLATYSLDATHEDGGPKAKGFERILAIAIEDIDYLEGAIQTGILIVPISSVRDSPPWGVSCVVVVPVRGLGERSGRVVDVRTVWLLTGADHRPRMTTAFLRP
jgi:hypothetical protein